MIINSFAIFCYGLVIGWVLSILFYEYLRKRRWKKFLKYLAESTSEDYEFLQDIFKEDIKKYGGREKGK